MEHTLHTPATAFIGHRLLATGALQAVALAVKAAGDTLDPIVVLDDRTGQTIDLDLRGSGEDILTRLQTTETTEAPRGRGRPKLGVVAREVTLLPRHWDWLNAQAGGASVALRKLVEEARRAQPDQQKQRQSQEIAYRAMSTLGGGLTDFEEASRALFAGDAHAFSARVVGWPEDVRSYVQRLAFA